MKKMKTEKEFLSARKLNADMIDIPKKEKKGKSLFDRY